MQPKVQPIEDNAEDYYSQKSKRKIAFIEKLNRGERPYPKEADQLQSINDILEDLEYPLKAFPKAAVQDTLNRKEEMTPILLRILKDTPLMHEEEELYMAPLFALFILSQLREKKAFPIIIELARLPEKELKYLLGDILTENFQQFIGSTYNGDLKMIKTLIEDPQACIWSRNAGLRSLLVLLKAGILEREFVLGYIKDLFHHVSFVDDKDAIGTLIISARDLYPAEVYSEIVKAYEKNMVDSEWIELENVDCTLREGKEKTLRRNIDESHHLDMITDTIEKMWFWAYLNESEKNPEERSHLLLGLHRHFHRGIT